ncbi:MAG: SDR family NAD(P)-dependent oxidoreductase [Magnetococcales bacterium]|nr:SDR family NAD(P)-dependent oxidoreductase [Magnetococcales bacterium]
MDAHRILLVTGCSPEGIGRAAARRMAARGWRIFAATRRTEHFPELRAEGLEPLRLDLADESSIAQAAEELLAHSGGALSAVFHNGAYGQPGGLEDLPTAALRRQFECNLFGVHELTRRLLPALLRDGGGRLLINSSVLGFVAMPWRGAYVASKFALEGWADALRLELENSGVDVVLIEPGPVETRFRANALAAFHREAAVESSRHQEVYRGLVAKYAGGKSSSAFAVGPEVVAKVVQRALESRRPRVRYRVTAPTKIFAFLKRVMTDRGLDRLLRLG